MTITLFMHQRRAETVNAMDARAYQRRTSDRHLA